MGKAIVQTYSDMITDGRTVGFLATTDRIVYCYIPPENRTHMSIYVNTCYREERGWGPVQFTVAARRWSPQVGLATLAWLARTYYANYQPKPDGLKVWCICLCSFFLIPCSGLCTNKKREKTKPRSYVATQRPQSFSRNFQHSTGQTYPGRVSVLHNTLPQSTQKWRIRSRMSQCGGP
jgi:hypothetical protein